MSKKSSNSKTSKTANSVANSSTTSDLKVTKHTPKAGPKSAPRKVVAPKQVLSVLEQLRHDNEKLAKSGAVLLVSAPAKASMLEQLQVVSPKLIETVPTSAPLAPASDTKTREVMSYCINCKARTLHVWLENGRIDCKICEARRGYGQTVNPAKPVVRFSEVKELIYRQMFSNPTPEAIVALEAKKAEQAAAIAKAKNEADVVEWARALREATEEVVAAEEIAKTGKVGISQIDTSKLTLEQKLNARFNKSALADFNLFAPFSKEFQALKLQRAVATRETKRHGKQQLIVQEGL
jgi:hypothetical protein